MAHSLLPTPFDFEDEISDRELDIFTECVVFDEYGEFQAYRSFEYLSETVDKVLNKDSKPLVKSDNFLARYSMGIKKNQQKQKNQKAKKELSLVTNSEKAEESSVSQFGTIDENLIVLRNEEARFASSETVEDMDDIMYSLDKYKEAKVEFQRIEGVDLDVLLVRALEEIPQAVSKLTYLVHKYKFLGKLVEDIMKARELGHNVLPDID